MLMQVLYILLLRTISESVRITPKNGWYVTDANRGSTFRFHCQGRSRQMLWTRESGVALSNQGRSRCTPNDDMIIGWTTITICKFRNEFAGRYTCQDPETKISSTTELGVSPEFVSSKTVEVVIQSTKEKMQLSCRVTSYVYPKPNVSWYTHTESLRREIFRGEVMTVTQPNIRDSNIYYCVAKNHPSGPSKRKIFFVKIYKPLTCTVHLSKTTVQLHENVINVDVVISSGYPAPEVYIESPWIKATKIASNIYQVAGQITTSGEQKVVVTQKIQLRNRSKVITASCSVFVEMTEPRPAAVCLLVEKKSNSSCFTESLNKSAMDLSQKLRTGLHSRLGCYWSIKIHYIFSRGRTNCTLVIIGMTVNLSSNQSKHCTQYPSTENSKKAIRNWINEQLDLTLRGRPSVANTRIYCRNIEPIQINLPEDCHHPFVHIPCSQSKGITRFCSACFLKTPRCRQIEDSQNLEFQLLSDFCMTFRKTT